MVTTDSQNYQLTEKYTQRASEGLEKSSFYDLLINEFILKDLESRFQGK